MHVAFYTGTRPGYQGLYNRLVRWWESGDCSHVELIFKDGLSASASLADGGVRFKAIDYNPDHWIIVDLGNHFDEDFARQWFADRIKDGAQYDLLGQLHFVFAPIRGDKARYWCSEAVASALQLREPWRYGPNLLKTVLLDITDPANAGFFTA
jgi:hypothetical protein